MADRVSIKVKKIADTTKKARERFSQLTDLKNEGFTEAEMKELFSRGTNGVTVQQIYSEYTQACDVESETKGKQLTVAEVLSVISVLKSLLVLNADKVSAEGWNLVFFEHEILCFLHVENHIAIRRAGFELLVAIVEIKFALNFAKAQQQQQQLAAQGSMESSEPQRVKEDEGGVIDRATIGLLLASIDWDFFRATYGAPIVFPNFIVEIRKARHNFVPPRLRSITAAVDLDREKEATAMLKTIIVDVFVSSALQGPPRIFFWYHFLYHHIFPIILPVQGFRAGVIRVQSWDSFAHGKHKRIHQLLVELIQFLRLDQTRLQLTFAGSEASMKLAVMILTDVIRDPEASEATTAIKSCTILSSFLKNPPPFFERVVDEVLSEAIADGNFDACVGLLSSAQQTAVTSTGGELSQHPSTFQALVEAYAELLLIVVQSPTVKFSDATRQKATLRLGHIAGSLSRIAATRPSLFFDEVIPYSCQAFWAAISVTIPIASKNFISLTSPILAAVEHAVTAAGSSPGVTQHPPLPYLIRCWSYLVLYVCKVFVASDRSAVPIFSFPLASASSSSSTASAGSGATSGSAIGPVLGEFRSKRTPVPSELCSRSIVDAMRGPSVHEASLTVLSEAIHNLLHSIVDDSLPTKRGKSVALCECTRILCEAVRNSLAATPAGSYQESNAPRELKFYLEADSLVKMIAPYLLIASHVVDTPAGPADQHPPISGKQKLSIVAKESLECIAEVVALPCSKPIDTTIFAVLMNRLDEVLASPPSSFDLDDCPGRILLQLARNNSSVYASKPSCCIFVNGHAGTTLYASRLLRTAVQVFGEVEPLKGTALTAFLDGKSAALNVAFWAMTFLLGREGLDTTQDDDQESLIGSFGAALRSGQQTGDGHVLAFTRAVRSAIAPIHAKYPQFLLTRICAALFSLLLRTSEPIERQSTLLTALEALMDIVLVHWNALERSTSMHPHYAATLLIVESLTERFSLANPQEQDAVNQIYSRLVTTLCSTIFYHMNNWLTTRYCGDSILQLLSLLSETTTRIGKLDLESYATHPRHRVCLIQLVADVAAYIFHATTAQTYALSVPSSTPRDKRIEIRRIESAYELMLEEGNTASSNAVTMIVIPVEDSSRKWLGHTATAPTESAGSATGDSSAPVPNSVARTINPLSVGHAATELLHKLLFFESTLPNDVSGPGECRGIAFPQSNSHPISNATGYKVGDCAAVYVREHRSAAGESSAAAGPGKLYVESYTGVGSCSWDVTACVGPSSGKTSVAAATNCTVELPLVKLREPAKHLEDILVDFCGPHTCPRELSGRITSPGNQSSIASRRHANLTAFKRATFPSNRAQAVFTHRGDGDGERIGANSDFDAADEGPNAMSTTLDASVSSLTGTQSQLSLSPSTGSPSGATWKASASSVEKITRTSSLFPFVLSIGMTGFLEPSNKVKPLSSSVRANPAYALLSDDNSELLFDGRKFSSSTFQPIRSQTEVTMIDAGSSAATASIGADLMRHFGQEKANAESPRTSVWHAASGHDVVLVMRTAKAAPVTGPQISRIFLLFLCNSYLEVAAMWAQAKQDASPSSTLLFLVPGPSAETVFTFCGRCSDGAPALPPFLDGACVPLPQVALTLRACVVASTQSYRRTAAAQREGTAAPPPLVVSVVRDTFLRALKPGAADSATVFSI